jgi:hypothetical protein
MKQLGKQYYYRLTIVFVVVAVMGLFFTPALAEQGMEESIVLQPGEDYRDYIDAPPLESLFDEGVFEEAFGRNWQSTFYGAADFSPVSSADIYVGNVNNGYIYPASGSAGRYRAVVRLPSGAKIVAAAAYLFDNNATDINWQIRVVVYNAAPIQLGDCNKSTSGTPGWTTQTCLPNAVVANGVPGAYIEIYVDMAAFAGLHGLFGVHLVWHRQIRTGLSHPFTDIGSLPAEFQDSIAALRASNITTGTTATTFSPNGNVTRAQMAVFLARALGLHWDLTAGY